MWYQLLCCDRALVANLTKKNPSIPLPPYLTNQLFSTLIIEELIVKQHFGEYVSFIQETRGTSKQMKLYSCTAIQTDAACLHQDYPQKKERERNIKAQERKYQIYNNVKKTHIEQPACSPTCQ